MSGLQPSGSLLTVDLGLRPRLVCRRAFGPQPLHFVWGGVREDNSKTGGEGVRPTLRKCAKDGAPELLGLR